MTDPKQKIYLSACVICIITLWGLLWLQYWYAGIQSNIAAETTVANLSKAFEENIIGTIRHLDEFLVTLRRNYPQHQEQIPELIASYNRHSDKPLIIQISITNTSGIMVYNSKAMPDKPLDLSDREHVRVQKESRDDQLFISKPVLGRASKKWSIQFTRKIVDVVGAFAGVVILSVDPDYFTTFYKSIDLGDKGAITLVGMDGIVRARSTTATRGADTIGTAIPSTIMPLDPARPDAGIYHAPSSVDAVPRISSYRRLKSYPLFVHVAMSEETASSGLHLYGMNLLLLGGFASGGILQIFRLVNRSHTRQQRYTVELQEERQRLAGIIEGTNAGAWDWNFQTMMVRFNDKASEIIGYEPDELSPCSIDKWMSIVHPGDLVASKERLNRHFHGEFDNYEQEMRLKHKNGSWVWILNRGKVTKWGENGRPLLMQGVHLDINERKQADDRLRKLSSAIEQSPVSIVITDTDGKIEFVNTKFSELTGYTLEESIGQNPRVLNSGSTPPETFVDLWATIKAGKTWEGEFLNKTRDGELFCEHAVISAIRDEHGTVTNYLAAKENITEKKKILEQLSEAKIVAESANVAKSEFLATMSHEIRTPMNGVIGMTGLLLDTGLNDEQRKYAEIIRTSGENLLVLINDILDFSKIEAGKLDIDELDFDLRITLEDTAELFALQAVDAGLELICRIDPTVPMFLKGDPGRLRQVMTNLVGNAIKFTDKGEIIIRATVESECEESVTVRFEVQDTGIGIPEKRLEAIFQPFTQVDGTTTRKYGGTGLGLAICKQFAVLMGGEIGVISEYGKGSTFWFTARLGRSLLLSAADSGSAGDKKLVDLTDARMLVVDENGVSTRHAVSTAADRGVRILLAEDNIINQKVAQNILNKLGFKADVVANGLEALRALELIDYDLVLMDCMMPEMDGFEATAMIRSSGSNVINHNVLVIAMTANAMKGDREKCLEAGMDDYLSKPVKKDFLAEVLAKWLPK